MVATIIIIRQRTKGAHARSFRHKTGRTSALGYSCFVLTACLCVYGCIRKSAVKDPPDSSAVISRLPIAGSSRGRYVVLILAEHSGRFKLYDLAIKIVLLDNYIVRVKL